MIYINEIIKTYYKKSNIITLLLIIAIVLAFAFSQKNEGEDVNWKNKLKEENISYEKQIKKSNGDMKKVLSEKVYKNNVYIKEDINPNKYNPVSYTHLTLPTNREV